jgi:hypothetical protein
VRRAFRRVWVRCGDGLRSQVDDDLVLIKALRLLLPPYTGPAVVLDAEVRQALAQWGVLPIARVSAQDPALVTLGLGIAVPLLFGNAWLASISCSMVPPLADMIVPRRWEPMPQERIAK